MWYLLVTGGQQVATRGAKRIGVAAKMCVMKFQPLKKFQARLWRAVSELSTIPV